MATLRFKVKQKNLRMPKHYYNYSPQLLLNLKSNAFEKRTLTRMFNTVRMRELLNIVVAPRLTICGHKPTAVFLHPVCCVAKLCGVTHPLNGWVVAWKREPLTKMHTRARAIRQETRSGRLRHSRSLSSDYPGQGRHT